MQRTVPARAPEALDAEGWLSSARRVPSPNFDARPAATAIDLLVIHCISLPRGRYGGAAIEQLFCNRLKPAADPSFHHLATIRVSAHFVIARSGALTQFVSCHARAWHAGVSRFGRRTRCNDFSLGVELEGTDDSSFTAAQYRVLASLTRALCRAFPITAVRGHSDIAPGRKTDPGSGFDWKRYARAAALSPRALPAKHRA